MNPDEKPLSILFLCTGNSARSIIAEHLMPLVAPGGKFLASSAGSEPKGEIHPMTRRVMKEVFHLDLPADLKPKSWDEFKGEENFDFVITVCDDARDSCPVWPGQPIGAHWGSQDPAAAEGSEEERFTVFKRVALEIRRRLELFTSLPFAKLDRLRLEQATAEIGEK